MQKVYKFLPLYAILAMTLPAYAQQKSQDPNLGHFYMGRQEWSIENTGPVINDNRSNGQPGGNGGFMNNGASPLPKSGWQPYSSTIPSVRNNLPKVETGVPKPMPQPKAAHAKAGNLRPQAHAHAAAKPIAPKPSAPAIETYRPYSTSPSASGSTSAGSSATVHGSLLQQIHQRPKSY